MSNLFTIGLILTAMDKASSVIGNMCNKSMQDLNNLQMKFKEVGEKMQSLGMKSMASGMVMTGAIQKTIKEFADLEEAQTFLKTTMMDATGKATKEYEELLKIAEKLGTELPGSTKDMLEMFIGLREQGVQTKNIINGVGEAAAKFAVLMKVPFKEAAVYVAKFQETMGVSENQMVAFMDQLQRLKFAAGIEVGDLAYTFRYLGSTLKTLNIQGLEESKKLSAVIGLLATNSIEGSTAGTNFAQALMRMAEVSHKLDSKKIKELVGHILDAKGIKLEFFTEEGKFKGLEAMIVQLEKLKALSAQERIMVLKKIFGDEASRVLTILSEQGIKGYTEMLNRMEQQADMQKKIQEIMSTTKMVWDSLSGTVKNTVAYFGGAVVKALQLNKIMNFVNNIFGKIGDWIQKHERLAGVMGAVVAVAGGALITIGGALVMLGMAAKLIGSGIAGAQAFLKFIQIAIPWIRLKRLEVLRLIGVQKAMDYISYHGGFWKAMQYFLMTTKFRIYETILAMKAWIVAQWSAFHANFLTIAGLKNMAHMFGSVLMGSIKTAIAGLKALRIAMLTNPVGLIITGIALAAGLIYTYWRPISAFFRGIWAGIKEGLSPLLEVFKELFRPLFSGAGTVFNFLKPVIGFFKELLIPTGIFNEKLGTIANVGRLVGKVIAFAFTFPVYSIISIIRAIKWFVSILFSVGSLITQNWKKVLQIFLWTNPITAPIMALNKLVKFIFGIDLFQAGFKIINSLWEGMKSVANKPVQVIKEIAQKIKNMLPFSPAKEGPLATLHKVNLIGTIAEGIKPQPLVSGTQKALQTVKSSIEPLTQPIQQVLKPAQAIIKPLTQPVIQKLQTVKSSIEPQQFAYAGVRGFNIPSINITQHLTINGANIDTAKDVAAQVSTITKETIFRAIDDYFRTKKREAWQ